MNQQLLEKTARLLWNADAILLCTGAGMSGLGTFRGPNACIWPPLRELGMEFPQMSNPIWFRNDARLAWAFWQFRYNQYTRSDPHEGFYYLKSLCERTKHGGFSFTSNIDGHWFACGFPEDRVYECHGSVRFMQCQENCNDTIWPTDSSEIAPLTVDATHRAVGTLPKCHFCELTARPNVLMFNDFGFDGQRIDVQGDNYEKWFANIRANAERLVIVEIGAGTAVPTVRYETETTARMLGERATIVRINPSESDARINEDLFRSNPNHISLEMNVDDALSQLKTITTSFNSTNVYIEEIPE